MTASDQPEKPNPSTGSDSANSNEAFTGEEPLSAASVSPNSIEGLFLRALQIAPAKEREDFIAASCGDDAERRKRVTALLRAYDDAGSFLETPAGGARPTDEISLSFLKATNKEGVLGTIGPYEVLEVIGRGGMGVVLRAIDPKLNRVVAVKALLVELAANPNSRRRFLREAQAAAAISHPHVVTIHAVDDTHEDANGKPVPPYLVMEFVAGQSLQEKLDRVGTLRQAEILRIGRQIGEGLAAAHKQGVIHRDIKPANILLENGVERVKITDFGLARAIDDITVTRTGEVSGTPQYMSPEQAFGERVDHRSDLFSLGCVMYAICTGHSPFRGDSIAHVIKRVTQDTPRPISNQNPEIPLWLIEIITCLLQKNPEHRFQSAEGVVAILDQHLQRIQHPRESGSHSVINQQVPAAFAENAAKPAPVAVANQPSVAAPPVATAGLFGPSGKVLVLNWMGALSRIWLMLAVAIVLLAIFIQKMPGVGVGSMEMMLICSIGGLGSIIMTAVLSRRAVTRESMACALFVGLGPLGLLLFYLIKDRLQPDPSGEKEASLRNSGMASVQLQQQEPSQTVGVQFGEAIVQVPVENYLHYAAAKRLIRIWILMTLGGVLNSLLGLSSIVLQSESIDGFIRRVAIFAAVMLSAWGVQMIGVWIRGQVSLRNWALLSSVPFGCLFLGYFWTTVLRMRFANPTIIGWAIIPTVVCVLYAVFVLRVSRTSPEFRKQFVPTTTHSPMQKWWLPVVVICFLGFMSYSRFTMRSVELSPEDSHKALKFVAQRFHKPVSLQSIGIGQAVVVVQPDTGNKKLIHLVHGQYGLWELDPAQHATTFEIGKGDTLGPANSEWGGLILDTEDTGIHVALIGTGPRIIGFQPPLIPAGRHKIPVGSYIPLFFDTQAGWLNDVKSSPQGEYKQIYKTIDEVYKGLKTGTAPYDAESGTYAFAQYTASPASIDIQPGKFVTVSAHRDLRKLANGSAYFNRDAAERFMPDQFYRFLWNGKKYSLSDEQAKVIDVLLHAMADGKQSCSKAEILKAFDKSKFHQASVKFVFNNGNHPAWGEVIAESEDGEFEHFRMVPLTDSK